MKAWDCDEYGHVLAVGGGCSMCGERWCRASVDQLANLDRDTRALKAAGLLADAETVDFKAGDFGEVSGQGYARKPVDADAWDPGTTDFDFTTFEMSFTLTDQSEDDLEVLWGRKERPDLALAEIEDALRKHDGTVDWSSAGPEQAEQMMAALDAMRRAQDHLDR